VVVHLVEANLVAPILMHRRVALPPVLTILSVLVMAKLAGPIGLIVAVPALATVMVLVRHILIGRVYGGDGAVSVVGGQPSAVGPQPSAEGAAPPKG
jgi:predicted PurR-regulated permease PerM